MKILVFMGYIMCRTQCVLAVVALYVGLAHSSTWDYAVITTGQIDYYSDKVITHSENIKPPLKYINDVIYDETRERMFLVNFSEKILSYDLKTNKFEAVVLNNDYTNHNLQSIAYDPVEQKLFWLDSRENTIRWVSLKPGAKNDDLGNVLATLDIRQPITIAVDSCNGYIYWTDTKFDIENYRFNSSIQRIRLDGGSTEVVLSDIRGMPLENSLVVDHNSKKLYWIVKDKNEKFYIESANLDGSNKVTVFNGTSSDPTFLAVSKDSLYWSYNSKYRGVNQKLTKDKPHRLMSMYADKDSRIVTNYKLDDNIQGCERQKRGSTDNAATNVNTVCHNYCLNGDCTTSAGGQPQCRCKPGFSGDRCEVDLCRGHCLNGGRCSIDKNNKPVCQCTPSFFGSDQCEIPVFLMKTFVAIRTLKDVISLDMPPLPSKCADF